jgi:hypothetical protein
MAVTALTALVIGSAALGQEQTLETRIGKLTFTHDFANGYPTEETVKLLYDERDFQRAVQVYLWSMPMVSNGEVRRVLMEATGAQYGDLVPLSRVPDLQRIDWQIWVLCNIGAFARNAHKKPADWLGPRYTSTKTIPQTRTTSKQHEGAET